MTGDKEPKRWIGPLFEVPADFVEPAPHPVGAGPRLGGPALLGPPPPAPGGVEGAFLPGHHWWF